jgi:hypothetical protein
MGIFLGRLIIDNFIEVQRLSLCFGDNFFQFSSLQTAYWYKSFNTFLRQVLHQFCRIIYYGHGGHRGQVPSEEVRHCDRNVQDVMIEDLQRQVVELTQRLAA